MTKRTFKPLLGLTEKGWLQVDYASTMMIAGVMARKSVQMLGDYNLLGGLSKTASKVNFGLSNKTWNYLDAISTSLYALILLHGAVDAYEERRKIPSNQQLLPGKGLVYRTYELADNVF